MMDISRAQKFPRRSDAEALVNTKMVEGAQNPKHRKKLHARELDEDDEATAGDLVGRRKSGADELREKLVTQRNKLPYY